MASSILAVIMSKVFCTSMSKECVNSSVRQTLGAFWALLPYLTLLDVW